MRRFAMWSVPGVALAALALSGGAEGVAAQQLPEGVTQAMITEGQQVFAGAGLCASCHGEAGVGTALAPNLADGTWLHIDGSFPALVTLVTQGVPQPKESMVPMLPKGGSGISDAQVRAVAAYVWSLSNK